MIRKKEEWVGKVNIDGKEYHRFKKVIYIFGIPTWSYIHHSSTSESLNLYNDSDEENAGKIGFGIKKTK